MPTQDALNPNNVSAGESTNNAPAATGPFQRAWNRLSALGLRRHETGEDQIERGEHTPQAQDAIIGTHGGHAEAGATPLHGPPGEVKHSRFSSTAFDRLPQPVLVEDVFFGSWWLLSALRTATRPVVIYYSVFFWLWSFDTSAWSLILGMYFFRWLLLMARRDTIPLIGTPIPGKRQLFWALFHWIQKIWEHLVARVLLKSGGRYMVLCKLWWFVYLLICPMAEFKQNYMAAWRQRKGISVNIFVDEEHMSVPIPADGMDEIVLARIRSFYQMMLVGQGFPALVFPKQLQRIDLVEMAEDSLVLGSRLETLQLGRYKGRLVNIFENPELGAHTDAMAESVRAMSKDSALEFQRTYDVGSISVILAVPAVASLIFGIVWVRIYAHKANADFQVVVQTAFTVSSYIVTAGALTLALIAFLDQKRAQNDDMIERIARRSLETKAATTSKLDRRSSLP